MYVICNVYVVSVELTMYCAELPSRYTCKSLMSAISVFPITTSVYPVVPVGPLTVKLSSLAVELKARSEMVELEITENTEFSSAEMTASVEYTAVARNPIDSLPP